MYNIPYAVWGVIPTIMFAQGAWLYLTLTDLAAPDFIAWVLVGLSIGSLVGQVASLFNELFR